MNAQEIASALARQAEDVCQHLLPNGKRIRNEWTVGNVQGDAGKSLHIRLTGDKAGYWKDHADDSQKGRSLLKLWSIVRCGGDYVSARKEALDFLGIEDNRDKNFYGKRDDKWKVHKDILEEAEPQSAAIKYLSEERQIPLEILRKYRVKASKKDEAYCFHYFWGSGPEFHDDKICGKQAIYLKRDERGKKIVTWAEDSKRTLFGKQTIPRDADYIIITEGQIDAMTWATMGYHAVSCPSGTSDNNWVDIDWEWLDRFERIYLSYDADASGQKAIEHLMTRLGRDRSYIIKMPMDCDCKDANELLAVDCTRFAEIFEAAKPIDPAEIRSSKDFEKEVWNTFFGDDTDSEGIDPPWDLPWKIRNGEVTLFTGYKKHGKSSALLQLSTMLLSIGKVGMIASLEVPAKKTIKQIIEMGCGKRDVTPEDFDKAYEQLSGLLLYDKVGSAKWQDLIDTMRYAARRYNCWFFVIDSLLKCGISSDDYQKQKDFVNALCDFVNETQTHVFLVAHSRKAGEGGEGVVPGSECVKGSGDISDLVFNQIAVWRNFKKEKAYDDYQMGVDTKSWDKFKDDKDAVINLQTQRYGGGKVRWLNVDHSDCGQYVSDKELDRPYAYLLNAGE